MLHRLFLLCLLILAVPSRAFAAWGEIVELSAPDAQGQWRPVATTTRVLILRGEARLPAARGMVLEEGDRIVTEEARARLTVGTGEEIAVGEHADLEVRARTVLQRLGDVYYSVRGAFEVRYGTVQTTVEGTEFAIDGNGASVRITVIEGRVRVNAPAGETRLRRWQTVESPAEAPPASGLGLRPVTKPAAAARIVERAFGRPRAEIGLFGAAGLEPGGVTVNLRALARVRLAGALRLAFDTAIGTNGRAEGLRLPQAMGLELGFGPLAVGTQLVGTFELARLNCDGAYTALHLGGVGSVRYGLPLSRRVSAQVLLRGGYVQGPMGDLGLGFAVAL
ncbi:hypothetical protein LBMAG42_21990 [Deltaproteobacteria bacterium]|nr:hypothetical protein LBMAG42_21990 [Deltaproteobacteria bacterium]